MHLPKAVDVSEAASENAAEIPPIPIYTPDPHQARLVARALEGDDMAWVALIRAHEQPVFRLAWLMLANRDDAEEVAQETFIRAWSSLSRFDTTRPLRPWLLRIAHNLALNRRRSLRRAWDAMLRHLVRTEANAAERDNQADMEQTEEVDTLWRAVRQLSQADQQVIYLRYFLDLSVEECAGTLEVAPGTVKSRLSRALGRLRPLVERESGASR